MRPRRHCFGRVRCRTLGKIPGDFRGGLEQPLGVIHIELRAVAFLDAVLVEEDVPGRRQAALGEAALDALQRTAIEGEDRSAAPGDPDQMRHVAADASDS
jgi:hypothetical protein